MAIPFKISHNKPYLPIQDVASYCLLIIVPLPQSGNAMTRKHTADMGYTGAHPLPEIQVGTNVAVQDS